MTKQIHEWPGEWTKIAPKVSDHTTGAELVWAVRGKPFTRPILARSNVGSRIPGFAAKAEKFVYIELMADGFYGVSAGNYPFFAALEWRGPLLLPDSVKDAGSKSTSLKNGKWLWTERITIAAFVVILVVVLVGQYTAWRDCPAEIGTLVRGMFGLVCMRS